MRMELDPDVPTLDQAILRATMAGLHVVFHTHLHTPAIDEPDLEVSIFSGEVGVDVRMSLVDLRKFPIPSVLLAITIDMAVDKLLDDATVNLTEG